MKHTKYMGAAALAITAATAFGSSATAATLKFDLIESRFFNPQGGNVLVPAGGDTGFGDPTVIRWGQNALANNLGAASGYEFDAVPTPFEAAAEDAFALGHFTHFNNPINSGNAITGVNFQVRGNIFAVDGGSEELIGTRTFTFDIIHDETTNTGAGCCDDEVTISTSMTSEIFEAFGNVYTLNILGFSQNLADAENGVFDNDFFSPEGGDNERVLAAAFSVDIPDPLTPIPLPAAGWMLLAGIGGLAAMRRRKKA